VSGDRPLRAGFLGACPYPVPQGSQVFLRDHARAFVAAGHAAHLITYAHGVGEDSSGLPLHRGTALPWATRTKAGPSLAKPLLDLLLLRTVRQVVRRERLDVIFAHNAEALLVALAARACPVIYHAHNTLGDELPHYFGGARWAAQVGRIFDRNFPKRAHGVLVPHARLAEDLIASGCAAERVAVLAPPVWCEEFTCARASAAEPTVLYTGNLDPYQNLGLLHAAMAQVKAQIPEARLCIATAEPSAPGADEHWPTPDFSALRAVLARDVVFAVPRTSWSGYPVKLLNAMAAGLPIVACAGAAHGLVHEETALIVPNDDAQAFGDALIRLLRDPALRARLGASARHAAETQHHPTHVGEQLARAAERALAYSRVSR